MEHSLYNQTPIQQIRFPSNRQELDRCSRVIWDYTGGVPIYVSYVLSEWTKRCELYPEWRELSVDDLGKKLETIPMMESLFVNRETIKPRMVAVFSTMLLASALEIPLHTHGTHSYLMNLGSHSEYVLDIASHFGFYYTSDEASSTFTLVYPKLVLKYLETHYKQIPVLRFISHLFSMITQSDSPVDGVQSRKPIPLFQYVASFSSRVAREVSAAGLTYHPNAWNLFYEPFLSKEDGPGVGRSLIKDETEKFLIPVAQQLDLKAKNIVVIQLIISTKYSIEVTRQFTDHQNWILNSGVYYENDNGELVCQSLSSAAVSFSTNEWLTIPSRCQLVVCWTTSLQSFLGREAYSQLEHVFRNEDAIQSDSKLFPLSSALPSWLQEILKDEPKSRRVGFGMEMRSDANAMQVEYRRKARSAAASNSMDSSFDWKGFLLHEVRLDENRVNEYISKLPPAPVSLLKYITFQDLMRSGLKEEDVMKILFGLRKVSANH
eukprot:jgi/Galph1/2984/GphlegSOOS_G1641.1